jgi:hypothetical protein
MTSAYRVVELCRSCLKSYRVLSTDGLELGIIKARGTYAATAIAGARWGESRIKTVQEII